MPVDAVGLLGRVELRLVLGQNSAAIGDARLADQHVEIIPERLGELRLGIEQIHDPQVRRQAAHVAVVDCPRDVAARRQRPQSFETAGEIRRCLADRLRRHGGMARRSGFAAPLRSGRSPSGRRRVRGAGGRRALKQRADVEALGLHHPGCAGRHQCCGQQARNSSTSGQCRLPEIVQISPSCGMLGCALGPVTLLPMGKI